MKWPFMTVAKHNAEMLLQEQLNRAASQAEECDRMLNDVEKRSLHCRLMLNECLLENIKKEMEIRNKVNADEIRWRDEVIRKLRNY